MNRAYLGVTASHCMQKYFSNESLIIEDEESGFGGAEMKETQCCAGYQNRTDSI